MPDWFAAHKEGLRQIAERLVERRGFGIVGAELYQNVMDTNATVCTAAITKIPSRPAAELVVEDNDPEGFPDLSHAYTVFAPSLKKADPTKAGRFNVGEKFVLAFCREARVETTKGTVEFNAQGRREYPRRKREAGTRFWAIIDCTAERYQQFVQHMRRIIVKPGLVVTVNGEEIPHRQPIASFVVKLPTEIARESGELRRTVRQCEVQVFEPMHGEKAMLCELGIPVVETGDRWHYNVCQKVPLNVERDNVTPAYLRDLRTHVYSRMHHEVTEEDTEAAWVNEATSDDKCEPEAIEGFRVKKYGERSVAEDPFNPEANAEAQTHGFTVIPKHGLTKGQRENLKKNNFLLSSTQMFPLAGKGAYSDDPNAPPPEVLNDIELTEGMLLIREYTEGLARRLLGKQVAVGFVNVPPRQCGGQAWDACYGRAHLLGRSEFQYNIGVLSRGWFESGVAEAVDDLILHEFGHEYETNHLSEGYYRALTKLGARLKRAVLADPDWFHRFAASG